MEQNNVHLLERERQNDNNRLFAEGAARAGFHPEQFPLNLRGCRGSSLCNLGCPNNAKQGTNRVQLPSAERQGVEVVTRAEVRRVGQGFTCHPAHILAAEHLRPLTNDVGHPKSFYVDRAESDGYVLETCMYFPFTTAKNLTGFGPDHSALMRAFPRLQMILVLACDRAVPENRITAEASGRPVVHYRFTKDVVTSLVRATRASARIFFAAGALRVHAPEADPPLIEAWERDHLERRIDARFFRPGTISVSAAHLMGGCGMGRSAADSVTDAWGRVHGHPWLRVADASLFPDALQINPYLTIMALADRVAEGVLRDSQLGGLTTAAV